MELESVTLKLSRDLLSGAQRVASARDVTIGHMVRQLLKREVARQFSAQRDEGPDPRLLSALQALLARDIADATDWVDLASRLRPHGYVLRPSGDDVVLVKSSCGTHVCTGAELGSPYDTLVKRFGSPMPGHAQNMTHLGTMPAGQLDPTRHAALCGHISAARSWPDLINRLAVEGMELRMTGTDLGIFATSTGRHLCNTGTIGVRYATLVNRYNAPLPGQKAEADILPLPQKTQAE